MSDEGDEEAVDCGATKLELFAEFLGCDEGFLVEVLYDEVGVGGGFAESGESLACGSAQGEDFAEGVDGGFGGFDDGDEEEA